MDRISFQQYMETIYAEDGNTDMDLFLDWIGNLPIENLIDYADKFAIQKFKEGFALARQTAMETLRSL